MRRISDPFLVFDSDGIEVQDPPDYYSADCLGEKKLKSFIVDKMFLIF